MKTDSVILLTFVLYLQFFTFSPTQTTQAIIDKIEAELKYLIEATQESDPEYYGKEIEKNRQIWETYYNCLNKQLELATVHNGLPGKSLSVLEGERTRLDCQLCVPPSVLDHRLPLRLKEGCRCIVPVFSSGLPGKSLNVLEGGTARLDCQLCVPPSVLDHRPPVWSLFGEELTEDDFTVIDKRSGQLSLYALRRERQAEGLYRCRLGRFESRPILLHIILQDDKSEKRLQHVRGVNSKRGPHAKPESIITFGDTRLVLFSGWTAWSECSRCGEVGVHFRFGGCTIRLHEGTPRRYKRSLLTLNDEQNIGVKEEDIPQQYEDDEMNGDDVPQYYDYKQERNRNLPKNRGPLKTLFEEQNTGSEEEKPQNEDVNQRIVDNAAFYHDHEQERKLLDKNRGKLMKMDEDQIMQPEEWKTQYEHDNQRTSAEEDYDHGYKESRNVNQEDNHDYDAHLYPYNGGYPLYRSIIPSENIWDKEKLGRNPIRSEWRKKWRNMFRRNRKNNKSHSVGFRNSIKKYRKLFKNYLKRSGGKMNRSLTTSQVEIVKAKLEKTTLVSSTSAKTTKKATTTARVTTTKTTTSQKTSIPTTIHASLTKDVLQLMEIFSDGLPCDSPLLPEKLKSHEEVTTRGNEIMEAYCKTPCQDEIFEVKDNMGNILERVNNSAGIFSSFQGLPPVPPLPSRDTIFAEIGSPLVLVCPGHLHHDIPFYWTVNRTARLYPRIMDNQTEGRVTIDFRQRLIFKELEPGDTKLYVCWQQGMIAGVVRLVVYDPSSFTFNHHTMLIGLAVILGSFVYLFARILINKGKAAIA